MPDLDQDNYVATIDYGRDPQLIRTRCGGCEWIGSASQLTAIEACSLTPGNHSPAGRCPACGTLAYVERQLPPPPFKTPVYLAAGKFLCAGDAELIAQLVDHTPEEGTAIVRLINAGAEYDDEVEVRDPDPGAELGWRALCAERSWSSEEQLRRISAFLSERGLYELLLQHAKPRKLEGEPIYTWNGYRFYEQADSSFLVMDGSGDDARSAAAFSLSPSGRPANVRFLGIHSTQRSQLQELMERFAALRSHKEQARGR